VSIVKNIPETDIEKFVTITANAYPGWGLVSDEDRQKDVERLMEISDDPWRSLVGLYRQEQLLGGMIYYDFDMTFETERLPAAGVGRVAVDLLHKKEKVAHDMVKEFIYHYREKEVPLLLLYPFRPDFYYQMGFGYGSKMSSYRFQPSSLPAGGKKERVRFIGQDDKEQLLSCYNRFSGYTHGMILRNGPEIKYWFNEPTILITGYFDEDILQGYLVLKFEQGQNFLDNRLIIIESLYENHQALSSLLAFLRSQIDQVAWITYTTYDESFHHVLSDPRNDSGHIIPPVFHESNQQGVGLMYRVIDTKGFFNSLKGHRFGTRSLRMRLKISDDFVPENNVDLYLDIEKGFVQPVEAGKVDVEVGMANPEFSSMAVGVVRFRDLVRLGLAKISDVKLLDIVDSMFKTDTKPVCLTRF
jgi:predicted acetyltransferase